MIFRCRVYDKQTAPGKFDDIAVIQHDSATGNTCWFQVPTLLPDNRCQNDGEGNCIFTDIDGALVDSPMDPGAERLWLHPFAPGDTRGYVADQNCQRCHDADPLIWTPYLEPAFPLRDNGISPPDGWVGATVASPYVPGFLGIFGRWGGTTAAKTHQPQQQRLYRLSSLWPKHHENDGARRQSGPYRPREQHSL